MAGQSPNFLLSQCRKNWYRFMHRRSRTQSLGPGGVFFPRSPGLFPEGVPMKQEDGNDRRDDTDQYS